MLNRGWFPSIAGLVPISAVAVSTYVSITATVGKMNSANSIGPNMIQSAPIIGRMAFCAASVAFLMSLGKCALTHPSVSVTFPMPVPTTPRSPNFSLIMYMDLTPAPIPIPHGGIAVSISAASIPVFSAVSRSGGRMSSLALALSSCGLSHRTIDALTLQSLRFSSSVSLTPL